MIFERIKSAGIAHNSYLLGSGSDAAVIDPRRDCQIYIDSAQPKGLKIKHVFETHRVVRYLIRAGYDRIAGYLKDGTEGWYNAGFPIESLLLLSVHQLKSMLDRGEELLVLDTRGQDEWESRHIAGALHIYVGHLEQRLAEVPRDRPVAVICNVGHRAGLGASILLQAGYPQVYNVLGSVRAWVAAGFPVTTD